MDKVLAFTVGRVVRGGQVQAVEGKKPFCGCTLEIVKHWQGREFKTRVDCLTYKDFDDTADRLPEGSIASVSGEVSATTREYKGKTYANLRIVGSIVPVDIGQQPNQSPAVTPAAINGTTMSHFDYDNAFSRET